ncbi:MAG: substrate-binding domain-containing protein [Agriterribacter sp.]
MKSFYNIIIYSIYLFITVTALSCGNSKKRHTIERNDDLTSGTIHISVDETFKPIIDSQIKVFMSLFPKATIIAHYKSEAECLKDLMNDTIRLVIVTRGLSEEEVNSVKDTLGFPPTFGKIALDAISVIVNNKAKDSLFDMSDIRSLMNGTSGYKLTPVLDGKTATSTIRYMIDSVLKGQPLAKDIAGADSSQGVIDYVANHEDAIGFIGVSWIGNPEDKDQIAFLDKVKVASLESTDMPGKFVKPYQINIAQKRYPMVRGLYYIVKENYGGLGRGFTNFLQNEKGQLIFFRAYLVPTRMNFEVRQAEMK